MKYVDLKKTKLEKESEWLKRTPLADDVSQFIQDSFIGRLDGENQFVFGLFDDYPQLGAAADKIFRCLQTIKYHSGTRTLGLQSTSKVFGFRPRIARRNSCCSKCVLASENPRANQELFDFTKRIDELYARFLPDAHARQVALVREKILPDYRIGDTSFTSGIINRDYNIHYHRDKGNFKGTMNSMGVFCRGIKGARIVLPEFDVSIPSVDKSFVIFPASDWIHGVTKLELMTSTSVRFSVVFFALQQLEHGLPKEEEMNWARQRDLEKCKRQVVNLKAGYTGVHGRDDRPGPNEKEIRK